MKKSSKTNISYSVPNTSILENIDVFNHKTINKIIKLNDLFLDIDEILSLNIGYTLDDNKIVKTGKGVSIEGEELTGIKLLSEGKFTVRIDYCGKNDGCIYTFRETIDFNNSLNIPHEWGYNKKINQHIYIEDVNCEKINEREVIVIINFIFAIDKI